MGVIITVHSPKKWMREKGQLLTKINHVLFGNAMNFQGRIFLIVPVIVSSFMLYLYYVTLR